MGRIFKYLGSKETARQLWENRESLDKYIAKLKEFWDEDKQEWLQSDKKKCPDFAEHRPEETINGEVKNAVTR